jgi:uncharacterized protein YgiM (DUF1202 family)
MTKKRILLFALFGLIFSLACSLTANPTSGSAVLPISTDAAIERQARVQRPTNNPQPERCTVSAGFLNLRACAGTGCAVVHVLKEGEYLIVLERGGWFEVRDKDRRLGWINSKYCEFGE